MTGESPWAGVLSCALAVGLCACGDDGGAPDDGGVDSMVTIDTGAPDGSDGMVPDAMAVESTLFGRCTADAECPGRDAVCRTNVEGFPNGLCTVPCEDRTPCDVFGAYHHCLPDADGGGSFCMPRCVNGVDCGRDSYTCVGELPPSGGLCIGICGGDEDCGPDAECNPFSGDCGPIGSAPRSGAGVAEGCAEDSDCRSGDCLSEAENPAWVGGVCLSFCILPLGYNTNDIFFEDTLPAVTCPGDSVCFPQESFARGDLGLCLHACVGDEDCRSGYVCRRTFELMAGPRTFDNGFCEPAS